MGFMERLKWSTEKTLQRHIEVQASTMKMEMEKNQRKLASLNLMAENEVEDAGGLDHLGSKRNGNNLLAEFMPMPGTVPLPKYTHIWANLGSVLPWGGRFKTPKHEEKINVLNLFDVALNLRRKPDSLGQK